MSVTLEGELPHPDDEAVIHTNAGILRKVWQQAVRQHRDKFAMQSTRSVVVDISISKLRGGLGALHKDIFSTSYT